MANRQLHGQPGCTDDASIIYYVMVSYAYAYGYSRFTDVMKQEFTPGRTQQLAISYQALPGGFHAVGQNNGRSYHRASQGPSAYFIDAGNVSVALRLKDSFFSKRWRLEVIYQPSHAYAMACLR